MANHAYDVDVRDGPSRYDPYAFPWAFSTFAGENLPGGGWKKGQFILSYSAPGQWAHEAGRTLRGSQKFSRLIGWFKSREELEAAQEFLVANTTPKKFFAALKREEYAAPGRAFAALGHQTDCKSS